MTAKELIARLQALSPERRELPVEIEGEPGCGPLAIECVYVETFAGQSTLVLGNWGPPTKGPTSYEVVWPISATSSER
jgi:hypothetical protein